MPHSARDMAPTWILLGAGGHARSVADVIVRAGGALVGVTGTPSGAAWPVQVLGSDEEALALAVSDGHAVALGTGANDVRTRLLRQVVEAGVTAPPVVAVSATVAPDATLGPGTVVLEHVHVGPASEVGPAAVLNTSAVVEHDCVLGDGAHLAPGAVLLGGSAVGPGSLVGSGARVLPGIRVGRGSVVAAGAVVTHDVMDGQTVAGVPAVVLSR